MTQFLPPNLLALFAPRDPIPYLPPLEKLPHEKHHNQPYCGIAPYIREFEDPRDAPPPTRAETREERMERKRREKIERRQQEVETELKMCKPLSFSHISSSKGTLTTIPTLRVTPSRRSLWPE
uniref:Small nuclear ribonucleoprotein U1 subunit 70 n=1 Tax=Pipistrellus kuhlii TaxID=59472 RepID=A0A7J7RCM6_PIPKU|nr:small nuclear ribonucleoprotein U1 subunit 70 [Pipistrellus kuhlii]